jgi:hypothetical protein
MSVLLQTLTEPAIAAFFAVAGVGAFLAFINHLLTIAREKRAEQRKREAEKCAHQETAQPASCVPSCLVVTTGMQQNVQVNFLVVNQYFGIQPPRDDTPNPAGKRDAAPPH